LRLTLYRLLFVYFVRAPDMRNRCALIAVRSAVGDSVLNDRDSLSIVPAPADAVNAYLLASESSGLSPEPSALKTSADADYTGFIPPYLRITFLRDIPPLAILNTPCLC